MKQNSNGMWNTYEEYAFYVQEGDWVDEDYAKVLMEKLKSLKVDMIFCGIIEVQEHQFKRANFYEYEKILYGKEGRKELLKNGYVAHGFCGCLIRKELLKHGTNDLYSLLLKANKIGILNDYKYYHRQEVIESGSYEKLRRKYSVYETLLVDWNQEELWELFTRKEKILLQYPMVGMIIGGFCSVLQKKNPKIYGNMQKIVDKQMEKRKKIDDFLKNSLKNTQQEKRILMMGTPEYHNLGDHAIAFAQERFCQHYFPEYKIISVTEQAIGAHFRFLQTQIRNTDILLLQGGGNMGDEYASIEELRLKMIRAFPQNKIVMMPQTIHFTNKKEGKKLLKQMQRRYGLHPQLVLTARESTSFERMKRYFPKNQVILCPDIVLFVEIQKEIPKKKRNGILLLMRTDAEGTLNIQQLLDLKGLCKNARRPLKMTETSISYGIKESLRREELMKKWEQISGAELVITDRLHGMVFAAITGTPCLVLGNYNHKVKESYEWIKNLGYIRFCNDLEEVKRELETIEQLCAITGYYCKNDLEVYYKALYKAIV